MCLLQLLDIGSATLVLNMLELGEVGEALVVGFQDARGLDSLDTILGEIRSHLVED